VSIFSNGFDVANNVHCGFVEVLTGIENTKLHSELFPDVVDFNALCVLDLGELLVLKDIDIS
jgi:hypothetical protein